MNSTRDFPKHTAYEFLVESGLHDQADELKEMVEKQEQEQEKQSEDRKQD